MVPKGTLAAQIDFLLKTQKTILATSPSITVEDALTQRRLEDSFAPTPNDAVDLHHPMVPLAYCDYFATGDKRLSEHCRTTVKRVSVACQPYKSLLEIDDKAT